jgi:TetR/AcrR family transcriptional regulator
MNCLTAVTANAIFDQTFDYSRLEMARLKTEDPKAKARILKSAERLFAARGFAGTAIRDIASGAGVNGAMIHYYFGNKEGLYLTLLESAVDEIGAVLIQQISAADSIREQLAAFVKAYATYIFSHPKLARILHLELLSGGKHFKELAHKQYLTIYSLMRENLAESVRRGELRSIDVELMPFTLAGMVLVFQIAQPLILLALGSNKYDESFIDRLTSHTVELFLTGAQGNRSGKQVKC